MRQLLLILAFLMGTYIAAYAETVKLVPSTSDSTKMDTVVVSELQDAEDDVAEDDLAEMYTTRFDSPFRNDFFDSSLTTITLVSIIICCGLPFFIVAIVLWFRYKNKQARYKLAAEALAAGQTIPKELFNDPEEHINNVRSKGIRNIFLGIGIGVFLWVLTEEEGLAAIGFLIFCMGLGQVLIAYTTDRGTNKDNHFTFPTRRDKNETDTQHNNEKE